MHVLLDEFGQPLSARLQHGLWPLAPQLRRDYPALGDECLLTEVLEEAGQRIAAREERSGAVANLPDYAWIVAKRIAALRIRCGEWAVVTATLPSDASETALRYLQAGFGTSEQIFNELLCKELTADLRPDEWPILRGKQLGHSDEEIATGCGSSRRTVYNVWKRLKRKLLSQALTVDPRRIAWKKSRTV
jgi:hypothetical protein